jgi:hypothetical protein
MHQQQVLLLPSLLLLTTTHPQMVCEAVDEAGVLV